MANNPSFHPTFGLLRGFDVALWEDSVDLDRSSRVTAKVLAELEKVEEPFLCYLHYLRPHVPYDAHQEIRAIFGRQEEPIFDETRAVNDGRVAMTEELLKGMRADYDSSLRMVDAEVGKLTDFLAESELLERTVVLIMSDHGEAFGEHGMVDHVWTVYDEMTHIPLIVHYPKSFPEGKNPNLVDTVDLFPTLCELAGVAPPATVQGRSLLGEPREYIFSRSLQETPSFAVRSLRHKMIRSADGKRSEFYDLRTDRGEMRPLESDEIVDGHRQQSGEMESVWTRWLGLCLSQRQEAEAVDTLDADLIFRLKSLGYLQ